MSSDLKDKQDIEFYAASVEAWFNTRIEHDKSLLTLSAGGIGLLITLLTTVGASSIQILLLYGFAILFFLVCIISILVIFKRNSDHLVRVIQGKEEKNILLQFLDKIALCSFIIAILLSSILAISIGTDVLYSKMEVNMSDTKKEKGLKNLNESFNGISELKKSFNGVAQLRPSGQGTGSGQQTNSANTGSENSGQGDGEKK